MITKVADLEHQDVLWLIFQQQSSARRTVNQWIKSKLHAFRFPEWRALQGKPIRNNHFIQGQWGIPLLPYRIRYITAPLCHSNTCQTIQFIIRRQSALVQLKCEYQHAQRNASPDVLPYSPKQAVSSKHDLEQIECRDSIARLVSVIFNKPHCQLHISCRNAHDIYLYIQILYLACYSSPLCDYLMLHRDLRHLCKIGYMTGVKCLCSTSKVIGCQHHHSSIAYFLETTACLLRSRPALCETHFTEVEYSCRLQSLHLWGTGGTVLIPLESMQTAS